MVTLAADRLTTTRRRPAAASCSSTASPRPDGRGLRSPPALNADGYEVVTVDAPGHGGSSTLRLDLPAGAEALGRTGGSATYIGYSMGGRLALHLAVARPDLVERLVLDQLHGRDRR